MILKQIHGSNHLFKHLSHGGTAWLLLWLHPSSGDDPLVRVPTAAHQQNLSEENQNFIFLFDCEFVWLLGNSDSLHNLKEEENHFLPIWFRSGGNSFLAPDCLIEICLSGFELLFLRQIETERFNMSHDPLTQSGLKDR